MSTYTVRGSTHNIVYTYRIGQERKQQWESYATELEAMQRKSYIDYLQRNKMNQALVKASMDYRQQRERERTLRQTYGVNAYVIEPQVSAVENENLNKTYREFVEKWLPFHARKKRFSPNTYDSYRSNLENHLLPYFGDRIMCNITAEEIDGFLDVLSLKPCKGARKGTASLSSSSVKKCYDVLVAGLPTAKKWGYIREIPVTSAPIVKSKKRRAWDAERVHKVLDSLKDDSLLHLAVHLAFVCSMRAGEIAGIDLATLDFTEKSLWITRQVQRVSDQALATLPETEVLKVFPKQMNNAKSSLILKAPKTESSYRKQYLTGPLLQEMRERLDVIQARKNFLGDEYYDYGLLICQGDGRPIDPGSLDKMFKERQRLMGIPQSEQIEFHGLRKSGQMHKVRLTKNNYQLVAESAGHSPEVLMSNYNEALDSEKRALSRMVERNFYGEDELSSVKVPPQPENEVERLVEKLHANPELLKRLMQTLTLGADGAAGGC